MTTPDIHTAITVARQAGEAALARWSVARGRLFAARALNDWDAWDRFDREGARALRDFFRAGREERRLEGLLRDMERGKVA